MDETDKTADSDIETNKSNDKVEIEMEEKDNENEKILNGKATKDELDSELVEVVIKEGKDEETAEDQRNLEEEEDNDKAQIVQDVIIEDEYHGKEKEPESRLG